MKQVDDIKKYFKEARINTNENKDNDVFNKILDAAHRYITVVKGTVQATDDIGFS